MDEILGYVSILAQDQYGNYVVQVCNSFLETYSVYIIGLLGVKVINQICLRVFTLSAFIICNPKFLWYFLFISYSVSLKCVYFFIIRRLYGISYTA